MLEMISATDAERLRRKQREEEMKKVAKLAVDGFVELAALTPEAGIYWTGTTTDLVELTHLAWQTGRISDACGRPMTFKALVHHIFYILHAREPRRPSNIIYNLQRRKCIYTRPLLERYHSLIYEGQLRNPLQTDLKKEPRR